MKNRINKIYKQIMDDGSYISRKNMIIEIYKKDEEFIEFKAGIIGEDWKIVKIIKSNNIKDYIERALIICE